MIPAVLTEFAIFTQCLRLGSLPSRQGANDPLPPPPLSFHPFVSKSINPGKGDHIWRNRPPTRLGPIFGLRFGPNLKLNTRSHLHLLERGRKSSVLHLTGWPPQPKPVYGVSVGIGQDLPTLALSDIHLQTLTDVTVAKKLPEALETPMTPLALPPRCPPRGPRSSCVSGLGLLSRQQKSYEISDGSTVCGKIMSRLFSRISFLGAFGLATVIVAFFVCLL